MKSDPQTASQLSELINKLRQLPDAGGAPVHLWDPEFCGDIDLTIKTDGSWHYNGSPINRLKLVKLFATVLKFQAPDKYFLVTPVEKLGIRVEDLPFLAIAMEVEGEGHEQIICFETNVGDRVVAGENHELSLYDTEIPTKVKPSVHIRAGLRARLSRALYYELTELVVPHTENGQEMLGVWSAGHFYPMARQEDCR